MKEKAIKALKKGLLWITLASGVLFWLEKVFRALLDALVQAPF